MQRGNVRVNWRDNEGLDKKKRGRGEKERETQKGGKIQSNLS